MTTEYSPRPFGRDADVRAIGEGLLACTLPREAWTHEAHLGACLWLLVERPDIDVDAAIGGFIRRYNESVGGVNDDTQGYHDSITRAYVAGVRLFLSETAETGLAARVNALLLSPMRTAFARWCMRAAATPAALDALRTCGANRARILALMLAVSVTLSFFSLSLSLSLALSCTRILGARCHVLRASLTVFV